MPSENKRTYLTLISVAIAGLKSRTGSSRQAIKAYITENHEDEINYSVLDASLRRAFKKGVEDGKLIQNKQSFKLSAAAKLALKPKKKKAGMYYIYIYIYIYI